MNFYQLTMATFRSFSRFVSTPNIVGLENIPVGHSALLTPNHLSYFDPILLGGLLSSSGRETRALAKSELFEVPIIGAVLKAIKQIPVQRGTSSAANSLNMAKDALLSGALVAIYPEGTIPRDGRLGQFKTGATRLAMETGVPVIPIVQYGANQIIKSDLSDRVRTLILAILRKPAVFVIVGSPIYLTGDHNCKEHVLRETERVRRTMLQLQSSFELL